MKQSPTILDTFDQPRNLEFSCCDLVFFDTEFLSARLLLPLSLGFVPFDDESPMGYFELEKASHDLSVLPFKDRDFVRDQVLSQLGNQAQLDELSAGAVNVCRAEHTLLAQAIERHLADFSARAKAQSKTPVLVTDFSGDLLVLSKLVSLQAMADMGFCAQYISRLVPEDARVRSAYLVRQAHLFNNPAEFPLCEGLARHHALLDAWVMKQCYLASRSNLGSLR